MRAQQQSNQGETVLRNRPAFFLKAFSLSVAAWTGTALAEWTDDAKRCYLSGGDKSQVIQYCTRAIESGRLDTSELSITYSNRAGQYNARGDVELAIADYNTAIRLNPNARNSYVGRGSIHRARGEETKALADFDKAISIPVSADKAWDYINRARAYRRKGDLSAALSDLDHANRLDPKIREVYVERGAIYESRNNSQKALENYDAALGLDSKDAEMLARRARTHNNLGDFQRALNDYNSALSLEPNVAARYASRALTHRILGNADAAISDYTHAIRLEPNRGLRYTARAAVHQAKGDWASALADYEAAIKAEPDRGGYRSSRASAYEYMGNYAAAITDRSEAIRLEPKDADWRVSRGWTLLHAGRIDEGFADFSEAIRMDPGAAGHYDSRGHAFLVLGRFDEARQDFERAIQLQPSKGVHYAWRAYVSLYRDQPGAGFADLDKAESVDRDYDVASMRGQLRFASGDLKSAVAEYSRYLSIRPNATSGFTYRGLARMVSGDDLRDAVGDLRRALQYNIWNSSAVLWLHVARARLGEDPRAETQAHAGRFDPKRWPGPAFKALLGEIPIQEMLAAARDPSPIKTRQQEAEAYFLAGQYYLSTKRVSDAKKMFLEVLDRKVPYTYAHMGARAQLALLAKP